MNAPVKAHIEEIEAALIKRRLSPTDVLVVKVPNASADLCRVILGGVQAVLERNRLPNRALVVPADWELEVVSQAELVGRE